MKNFFIAIDKIRTLDYLVDHDAEDFCNSFNEIYRNIAERYFQCRNNLNCGNFAASVKISEHQPPLLESLKLLIAVDFSAYQSFCSRHLFNCPEFISNSDIELLINDYYCKAMLDPLKAYYKKILLDRSIFMQLTLLRRLIILDPEKSNWINNIKPLEKVYLKEILSHIKHLNSFEDFHELAVARNQIQSNEWYSALPEDFNHTIEKKFLKLKNSFYQHRAEDAINTLQADFDPEYPLECAGRIDAIESYLSQTDYQPDEAYLQLKNSINTAMHTYEKQQHFDLVADELRILLEQPDCEKAVLESTLDKLTRFELPIPDRLDVRTVNKITGIDLFKQRKHRFKQLLIIMSLLVVLGLVGVSLFFYQRRKECNRVSAEINKLVKQGKFQQAESFYRKSLNAVPYIEGYSQLIKARSNLDEAIRNKNELDNKFITLKKQLIAARQGGFSGSSEQFMVMFENAAKYADDDLEKIFIKQLKVDYETVLNRRRQAAVSAFNTVISDISGRLRDYRKWEKLLPRQRVSELKSVLDKLLTAEQYVADLNADNKLRYTEYKNEIKLRIEKARHQQKIVDDAAKSFEKLLISPPDSLSLFVNAVKIIHDNVPQQDHYRKVMLYSELLEELQTVYGQGAEADPAKVTAKWISWRNDYTTLQKLLNKSSRNGIIDFMSSYTIKSLSRIMVQRKLSEEKPAWYYLSSIEYNQHWGKYNVTIFKPDKNGVTVPTKYSFRKTEYHVKFEHQLPHTKYATDTAWLTEADNDMPPALLFFDKYLQPVCNDPEVPIPVKLLAVRMFIDSLPAKMKLFAAELKPFDNLMNTDISSDWLASPSDIGNSRYDAVKIKYSKMYRSDMLKQLALIADKYKSIVAMYRWAVSPYFVLSAVADYDVPNLLRNNVTYLFGVGYRKEQNGEKYYPKIYFIQQGSEYRRIVSKNDVFNGMPLLGLRMEKNFVEYVRFSKKYNIVPDLFKSIQQR